MLRYVNEFKGLLESKLANDFINNVINDGSDLFIEFKVKHNKMHTNYIDTEHRRITINDTEAKILEGYLIRRR